MGWLLHSIFFFFQDSSPVSCNKRCATKTHKGEVINLRLVLFLCNLSSFICNENVIKISTLIRDSYILYIFLPEEFENTLIRFFFAGAMYVIRWFCTAHLLLRIRRRPPWKRASEEKLLNEVDWRKMLLKFSLAVVSCRDETQCVGNVHNVSNWQLFVKENVLLCFWLPQWNYMFSNQELFSTISP